MAAAFGRDDGVSAFAFAHHPPDDQFVDFNVSQMHAPYPQAADDDGADRQCADRERSDGEGAGRDQQG